MSNPSNAEASTSWRKELGIRPRKEPVKLEELDEAARIKKTRQLEKNRIKVAKSRAKNPHPSEEVKERKREYQRNLMRERRRKAKAEASGESSNRVETSGGSSKNGGTRESPEDTQMTIDNDTIAPTSSGAYRILSRKSPPPAPTDQDTVAPAPPSSGGHQDLRRYSSPLSSAPSDDDPMGIDEDPPASPMQAQSPPPAPIPSGPIFPTIQAVKNKFDFTKSAGGIYPKELEKVVWPGGQLKTLLPWLPDKTDPSRNLLQKDADHVRAMAKTSKLCWDSDWVTYIDRTEFDDEKELGEFVKKEMSESRVVVLQGIESGSVYLNSRSIWENLGIPPKKEVVVLDAGLRSEEKSPHLTMTMEEFCKGVSDTTRIQTILDCPTVDGVRPPFMKFIDEGFTTWGMLHDVNNPRSNIPLDVQKSASWLLFHQGLFHTYCHRDADGYASWIQILEGFKVWALVRPKRFDGFKTRADLYDACFEYLEHTPDENGYYAENLERVLIYAEAGDIIFMYPGCLHEVYTPIPSIATGGHFFNYSSLHLTEVSRAIDFISEGVFTNQSHPSTALTLSMMVAALPLFNDFHIRSKALSSLCRMVIFPDDYSKPEFDVDLYMFNRNRKPKDRVTRMPDVDSSLTLAKKIKAQLALDLRVSHKYGSEINSYDFIFSGGEGWLDPGPEIQFVCPLP